MVVDIPSDVSSAGSAIPPPSRYTPSHGGPPPIGYKTTKSIDHNGYAFTGGDRKTSRLDKDDEEEEDLDALIEELESNDPDAEVEEELETLHGARTVPEELLQTDTRVGLVEPEVVARRKKYGLNQMKEEKENLFLKFLGYFVGPIQFVMEVSLILLDVHDWK